MLEIFVGNIILLSNKYVMSDNNRRYFATIITKI